MVLNGIGEADDFEPPIAEEYATEELLTLAKWLQIPPVPGVNQLSPSLSPVAEDFVKRVLIARGVVGFDDSGEPSMSTPHAAMLAVASAPALLVSVLQAQEGALFIQHVYAMPELSVQHTLAAENLHRLELFETDELLDRVLSFSALEQRPAADASQIDTTIGALRAPEQADDPLSWLRAPEQGATTVRVAYRTGEDVSVSELSWIDAGDAGLWRVEVAGDGWPTATPADDTAVRITPARAEDLVQRVFDMLPGDEGQEDDVASSENGAVAGATVD